MISVGDSGAGIQYLEHRTNLRAGAWVAVGTNAAPFPPPAPNTWLRDVTAITNEFFRIRQK
jgi:hypothetical protein